MRKPICALLIVSLVTLVGWTTHSDYVYAQEKQWGKSVKGQVVFAGANIPQPQPLNVTQDQAHCLSQGPILNEEWVINKDNKGIKNVVVYITADKGARPPIHANLTQIKEKNVEMDQPVCAFVPRVLAMRDGQTLVVKNSAPVAHNVNWQGSRVRNPGGNVIVPPGGKHVVDKLKSEAPRQPVSVTCNIHTWMKGWIRVFDHPYYAVTDENGNFEIELPPAGNYTIWYWHETGFKGGEAGANGERIAIKANEVTDLGKIEWK